MGFVNNFQNIKYQIKMDVKLRNIKPLNENDRLSASDGHTKNEYITIKLLTEQNRLLGNENLTTEKIVDAIYEFPQKLDDDLLKVKGSGWTIKELSNIYIYV